MKQQIDKKEQHYNSILLKIKHNPLIVENIFSFIKYSPSKLLTIINEDKNLKKSLNSSFSTIKIKNNLSKELNENIHLIILYKKFEAIFNIQFNRNIFEEQLTEEYKNTNDDPSLLSYKINYYYKRMLNEEYLIKPPLKFIKNIIIDGEGAINNKQLVYLPFDKNKYVDGLFIHKNLVHRTNINELDVLYCIIDDNKYYNKCLPMINKDIKIKELYFIYKNGIINIDMYEVIKKYLSFVNKNNIEQITLNSDLIQSKEFANMINNALIDNKRFKFPKPINIKLINPYLFNNDLLKLYLGLFILFSKTNKIDDLVIFDTKFFKNNTYEEIENMKGNVLLIKCGISELNNVFIKEASKKFSNVIYYINNDGNNDIIDLEMKKFILLYSDIPINHISINLPFYCEITDRNDKIILIENNYNYYNELNFVNNRLLLLKKYKDICFSFYKNKSVYYKLFIIKNGHYYEFYYYIDNVIKTQFNIIYIVDEFYKITSSSIGEIEQLKFLCNFSICLKYSNKIKNKKKDIKHNKK